MSELSVTFAILVPKSWRIIYYIAKFICSENHGSNQGICQFLLVNLWEEGIDSRVYNICFLNIIVYLVQKPIK